MTLWDRHPGDDDFFRELSRTLPPIFTRETASRMIGGIFSPRTLSNLDAAGKGPSRKLRIGKKVAYAREDFLNWLRGMLRSDEARLGPGAGRAGW